MATPSPGAAPPIGCTSSTTDSAVRPVRPSSKGVPQIVAAVTSLNHRIATLVIEVAIQARSACRSVGAFILCNLIFPPSASRLDYAALLSGVAAASVATSAAGGGSAATSAAGTVAAEAESTATSAAGSAATSVTGAGSAATSAVEAGSAAGATSATGAGSAAASVVEAGSAVGAASAAGAGRRQRRQRSQIGLPRRGFQQGGTTTIRRPMVFAKEARIHVHLVFLDARRQHKINPPMTSLLTVMLTSPLGVNAMRRTRE